MKADLCKTAALVLVIAAVAGCAAGRAFSRAERAARAGDWDAAVQYYSQAAQANPNAADYKIALERAQVAASRIHLDGGRELEGKGDLEGAIVEFRKAAEFDPTNRQAASKAGELEKVLRDRAEAARPKPQIEQMKERAKQVSAEPLLNPASRQPLVFKFAAGIAVRQILDFLAQASGINIMFESSFQDATTTTKSAIDLDGVTLEQALNLVLTSSNLFYKVLNSKTILIIPDIAANRVKYEDQVIRTFYLSHADATEMLTLLNGILVTQGLAQNRPVFQANKGANSITIRGSASMVAIAERVIENNDKPRAEVVIDVEILEVNRTRVKSYGLNLSSYQIGMQFSPEAPPSSGTSTTTGTTGTTTATGGGAFNLNSVVHGMNTADFYMNVPSAVVKFLESDSRTKLIAKPSLRGAEGTKLTANLGDEIPVPSTIFQPLISGGTAMSPMTSFSYRSVGVNLAVTPRVTYDGDIILEIEVESSTKGSDVNVAGQNLPSFGSRKVATKMRLRDGESNLLAGLLRDDERKSLSGFPGGIHVPLIKDLFSANESQVSQTDIVMLLTPHVIRTQALTERNLQEIYIGTAQNPVIGGAPALIGATGETAATQTAVTTPAAGTPLPLAAPLGPPINTQPYGTPGAALVSGAPVGLPTPQGTPVVPPGSSPIPGTVMMPPPQPQAAVPQAIVPPAAQTPPVQQVGQAVPPSVTAPPPPPAAQPQAAGAQPSAVNPYGLPAAPATGGAAQVTITVPGPDWRVGQGPYTVTLSAQNMSRVSTISLTLTYSPTALKLRSLQEGSFMRTGVPTTAFAHQEDSAAGRIDLTISRSGDVVGATGGGTLAAIIFDAAAPGAVSFRLSGAANGPGGSIPLQFTSVTVTVK